MKPRRSKPRPQPATEPAMAPTAERIAQAGGGVVHGDDPRAGQRLYSVRSTVDRMLDKGAIDAAMHQAAQRYAGHWYAAGVAGVPPTVDLNRTSGGGVNTYGMAASEVQAYHREQYRQAVQTVGKWRYVAFEAVVCHGETLESVGRGMGEQNTAQAIAAAREMVKGKLHALACMWGLMEVTHNAV